MNPEERPVPRSHVDEDPSNDQVLERDDITRSAREPQEHLARPGWGAWEPVGPLAQDPDNTYLNQVDVVDEQSRDVDISPDRSNPSDSVEELTPSATRDFRREEDDPGSVRPVTEPPPSEAQ